MQAEKSTIKTILKSVYISALLLFLLIALPLAGITAAGKPINRYLQFPPVSRWLAHPSFSLPAFILITCILIAVIYPFLKRVIKTPVRDINTIHLERKSFPWWGYAGIAGIIIFWILAWSRFDWFAEMQKYTFTAQWICYIITINALVYSRTGHCMLIDKPRYFGLLFLFSAVFWWYFEYLNRFVQNWYYTCGEEFTPLEYFLAATFPFSTVLPAVLGTSDLLKTFPRLYSGLDSFNGINPGFSKTLNISFVILSVIVLFCMGIFPNTLFPFLWIAPLVCLHLWQKARGKNSLFQKVNTGNYSVIYLLALSGLVCGIFWETWNFYSYAKWIYTIPFVDRFHIFEMPLLGYAGYLPFGLECGLVGKIIFDWVYNDK
jgi:hypothetical protein